VAHARAAAGLGDLLDLAQSAAGLELRVRPRPAEHAGDTAPEADRVGVPTAVHLDVQAGGQRVDHGGADAVQTAGGRVGAPAELAAGVQLGQDDLDTGQTGLRLDVDGNAPAVVPDLHRTVVVEDHVDVVAVAAEGLVHGIVDDLPQTVQQTATVGRPDVHAGPFTDGFEPLEDEPMPSGVIGTVAVCSCQQSCGRHGRLGGHAVRSSLNFEWRPHG